MRANVRPFVREYKSRSLKAALHTPKKWFASDEEAQTLHRHRHDRAMQLDRVQKEAEGVFRRKEILTSPLATVE